MGNAQKVGRNQQDLLAGKTVDVQKKKEKNTEGRKRAQSSTGQKDNFSILQNVSCY